MYRVLVTDSLSQQGLDLLKSFKEIEVVYSPGMKPADLKVALKDADGIVIRSGTKLTADVLDGQTRLKVIARAGVGVDNVDLPTATRQGIIVSNTPDGNTISTAEHSIAMMMALCKCIGPASQTMREGKWDRKSFTGAQLAGKTVGVIGLGRIGIAVAKRCRGLEMTVLGYDPFLSEEKAAQLGIELYRDLDAMLVKCDILTVHTPLTEETKGMIGAKRLAALKKGVRIVNCARGGIVDEEALADAIESGHVGGAALDVFTKEPPPEGFRLTKLPQVLSTPHLAASTDEAQEQVALEAADIVANFLTKNEIRSAVNMVPISGKELEAARSYLDLAYRLGLLLAQLTKGESVKGARLQFKGDVATKPVKLIASAFTSGLLSAALDTNVSIVNADMNAADRGLPITTISSTEAGAFATLISVTAETDKGAKTIAGTTFGNDFLRLVRIDDFQLDSYLDGLMLIFWHKDVPGVIGAIGTAFGKHGVNISHMAVGRKSKTPGGGAVAILNLDNKPSEEALKEVAGHPDILGLQLVSLPVAGAPLPWLGL
ncbi:phosphoglycerate dehydrogenase [Planctomicrobium piriforme]|uniref:D-3-phosphoglycerate dehydrogenase n=1 Tax=Planctomicrobium piriforme TaxID=1576369 RepID=A0A1I3SQG5_9PLAN|nr:phosphoglycerate dehydrogenase [Planctomicrobium piriforme]SFJ59646.1 D-3-phosphoglycerate dehydrogenase [Planctomicrobium piriforme]